MTHRTPNGTRPDVSDTNTRHEVIVVGAGQAGLAIGYFLAQQRRDFTILEADREPAAAWRARWESLKLFTPARYLARQLATFQRSGHALRRAPEHVA